MHLPDNQPSHMPSRGRAPWLWRVVQPGAIPTTMMRRRWDPVPSQSSALTSDSVWGLPRLTTLTITSIIDYNAMSLWPWEATSPGRPTLRLHRPTKRDFRISVYKATGAGRVAPHWTPPAGGRCGWRGRPSRARGTTRPCRSAVVRWSTWLPVVTQAMRFRRAHRHSQPTRVAGSAPWRASVEMVHADTLLSSPIWCSLWSCAIVCMEVSDMIIAESES